MPTHMLLRFSVHVSRVPLPVAGLCIMIEIANCFPDAPCKNRLQQIRTEVNDHV